MRTHSELARHHATLFQDYVNELWIGQELKNYITDETFISQNAAIYLYYPALFWESFGNDTEDEQTLNFLCVAGYLCYRTVIENDTALDNSDVISEKFRFPLASRVCQEECLKMLVTLFPLKSDFWRHWNQCKLEFIKAVNIEKNYVGDSIPAEDYERLAEYKSTFGKIAIHASYLLSGSKNVDAYHEILESHRLFTVGVQILDDIDDFRKDFEQKQINIAHYTLKEVFINKGISWDESNLVYLTKQLYIQNVAVDLINEAISFFRKSIQQITNVEAELWKSIVNLKMKEAVGLKIQLEVYEKGLFAQTRMANTVIKDVLSVPQMIKMAHNFITNLQETDGSWSDFNLVSAGLSNLWATGYVLQCVSDLTLPFDLLARKRACEYLLGNRLEGGLWGWSTIWIADTDSTTNALLALHQNGYDIQKELSLWMTFQKVGGGFSTYNDPHYLASNLGYEGVDYSRVNGWTQTHNCVSAFAFYMLSKIKVPNYQYQQLKQFLISRKDSCGTWNSYWWTSPIYATCYVIKGLLLADKPYEKNLIEEGIKSLLKGQNQDGSFGDNYTISSPFYTGLVLDTLCTTRDSYVSYKNEIDNAFNWLKFAQMSDGSFTPTPSLQIPETGVIDPSEIKTWRAPGKKIRDNLHSPDFMRLFSTSQVVRALDSYHKQTLTIT